MTKVPKSQRDSKWFKAVQDQIEKQMKDHPEGRKRLRQWMQHSKELGLLRQIVERQKKKLPGLSMTMLPNRDIYGRPIAETRASSPYKPNSVDRELVDIAEATGYAPNPNPDHYSADLGFTGEERDAYHQHIGPQQFNALERYFLLMQLKCRQPEKTAGAFQSLDLMPSMRHSKKQRRVVTAWRERRSKGRSRRGFYLLGRTAVSGCSTIPSSSLPPRCI